MPTYIVKANPGEDFYVFWSTVVDAPVEWGTRKELEDSRPGAETVPERFARADETGTSALPGFFAWDETAWSVRECIPEWRILQRVNLRAFCESLDADDEAAAMAVTEPDPYDEEDES